MPKNSELAESECCQIIGFHKASFSRNNINKTLGFAKQRLHVCERFKIIVMGKAQKLRREVVILDLWTTYKNRRQNG